MGFQPSIPTQTRPSAWPSTFTFIMVGDSNLDNFNNNTSDYAGAAITAGCTLYKKGSLLSGNYAAVNGDGMIAYMAETLIATAGVTAVRGVCEAVSGAYMTTIKSDQLSTVLDRLETQGWTTLDLAVLYGWTNDASANGVGATGDWNAVAGDSITQWETEQRCNLMYWRVRQYHPEAVIVFPLPTSDDDGVSGYEDMAKIRAGIIAFVTARQAAGDTNCRYADTYGAGFEAVIAHADAKHLDPNDATKGAQAFTDLVLAQYYTP